MSFRYDVDSDAPYPFPFVHCDEHGRQRSCIVCIHVILLKLVPAHVVDASDVAPGEMLCESCASSESPVELLKLICARHAELLLRSALR